MTEPTVSETSPAPSPEGAGVSRRRLLSLAGAGAVTAGAVGAVGFTAGRASADAPTSPAGAQRSYPFHGRHQAGISTPVQDRLHFAAFDVTTTSRKELEALLKEWSSAAARMTKGLGAGPYGPTDGPSEAPPDDTGEAIGLGPSGLTITFGFGPSLFEDARGKDRFGLADRRPKRLERLPHFPADNLDPARSDGDLCIQACADDPQVAVHAVRNLARIAFGRAAIRWSQLGFGRTSSTSTSQETPRNLFGFKDGTANLKAEDPIALDRHVWVGAGDDPGADWMVDGSYLVARRISMRIEVWDRVPLSEQETIFGRDKAEGAPLSGGTEFTEPNFKIEGRTGPLIDVASHVRLAHPDFNNGSRLLRRGFNFTDGTDGLGRLDAGLFFIAFIRDPQGQYVPMQNTLAREDLLMEYLQHTGSAIFAVPPGAATAKNWVGESLFA
ncbi:MAG: deferrochelatase/peroxidase EfeB [Acidimicrobiales bacterium]|nr:deferrochelatase/peroxidase EfeB [Acidimicrobiales bacterium]